MSDQHNPASALSAQISSLLSRLRWRIRAYVWAEGLALAAVWIGLTFWLGLALDYVPVRLGASEMPLAARVTLLVVVAAVLAYLLYRWVWRRGFVPLASRSMAVLLERRFPDFHDSLLTAVELRSRPPSAWDFNPHMLAQTDRQALACVDHVRLRQVFNFMPLARNATLATIVLASVVLFGLVASDAFATWVNRFYFLSDQPWPRRTYIELLAFPDRNQKAAKGSSVTIRVRADATRPTRPPDVCTIYYRTEEGERGRVHMTKSGSVRDGFQEYRYAERPFKGILSSIRFDVVGDDHRLRDNQLVVVDSPNVIRVELDCELPAYTQLVPRSQLWRPGIGLPKGSRVAIRAQSNKDLRAVRIEDVQSRETAELPIDQASQPLSRRFSHIIDPLDRNQILDVTLTDTDGIVSQRPHRITLDVVQDQPPTVDVVLRGIGAAVTADARLPVLGTISDDYGVDRAWFELEMEGAERRQFPCQIAAGQKVDDALDLRVERSAEPNPLRLQEGGKLVVTVMAADKYNLGGGPNVGQGDRHELDVVTPSDLLALLEARELGLRRRLERMIVEMQETRDSLARVKDQDESLLDRGTEPEDAAAEQASGEKVTRETPAEAAPSNESDRADALRALRVERAVQHSQRAAQEVLGIAASFDEIRDELINNRVDSEDRRQRIETQISTPLKQIARDLFPQWDERLKELEGQLAGPAVADATDAAVQQADRILAAMEAVLANMLEVEDYNELVDMVRSLIREQQELAERTKREQRKRLLGPLGPGR
jgi:hypothetical protein